jgi:hypothetical protein
MYLDPGSGSLLIQLVLGAVLAIGIIVRLSWSKIKAFFTGQKSPVESTDTSTDDEDEPK